MNNWINVNDRLPEPMPGRMFSEQVLVCNMNSSWPGVDISELHFEEYEGKIVPTVWRGMNVTHWQLPPELPYE